MALTEIILLALKMFFISNPPEVFIGKGFLEICSKCTGKHPCQNAISIKLKATFLKSHFGMDVLR